VTILYAAPALRPSGIPAPIPDPPLIQGQPDGSAVVYPYSYFGTVPPGWDDALQLNQASLQYPAVRLIAATYSTLSTWNMQWYQITTGLGRNSVISFAGTGDAIRMYNPTQTSQNYALLTGMSGAIRDLTVDLTNAGAASNGLHIGDGLGYSLHNLCVRNATGAGSIGLYLHNSVWFTEKMWATHIITQNCTNHIVVNQTDGNNSFEYNHLEAHSYIASGQTGFTIENGAQWDGPGGLRYSANCQAGATAVMSITGQDGSGNYSKIYDCPLYVRAEGPSSGTGPVTINFGNAANLIQDCHGYLIFASTLMQNSNAVAGNLDGFRGRIFEGTSTNTGPLKQAQGQQTAAPFTWPGFSTPQVSPYDYPVWLYVSGGTVTGITINGTAVSTSGFIPYVPGSIIEFQGTVQPAVSAFRMPTGY
jgi:hypothetical protein